MGTGDARPDRTALELAEVGWRLGDRAEDVGEALTGFLDALPHRPRLLGLGEPTHLAEELPLLRNRLFEQLVERAGYRSVTIESDCLSALVVDDYVAGGPGSLDEVMATGFSHGLGAAPSNRELVAWMRRWNDEHDPRDRLRFAGFDAPLEIMGAASPRAALVALHGYLAEHLDPAQLVVELPAIERLVGGDARWTHPQAMLDPAMSVGGRPEVTELRLLAEELLGQLHAQSPHLVAATSIEGWERARLHGRAAAGLLRYHATMAEDSPRRMDRLMGQRDAMMAANLAALVEAEADRGPTLAFASSAHLQRPASSMDLDWGPFAAATLRWWSAGAIAEARRGSRYAFLAMAVGRGPERGLGAPDPGTVEGELAALGDGATVLVDARRFRAALGAAGRRPAARTDTTTDRGYAALDPEHLGRIDGIVYVDRIGPMVPSPF